MITLEFTCHVGSARETRSIAIDQLVIAGWTGADRAAVDHHIKELAELGVKPPSRVPCYYRAGAANLTQEAAIECLGDQSSGEVEYVVVSTLEGLWIGVGSDHTDRKVEAVSVAVSKQMCPKPIAPELWLISEIAAHWQKLMTRSWVIEGANRTLYQEGPIDRMLPYETLIAGYTGGAPLPAGTAMFCGTHGAIGGVRPVVEMEFELEDPVLGRSILHRYCTDSLAIEE